MAGHEALPGPAKIGVVVEVNVDAGVGLSGMPGSRLGGEISGHAASLTRTDERRVVRRLNPPD